MSIIKKYVVITPVRDEESFIGKTLESMANQKIIPNEHIIVDDGSTDKTGDIIDEWCKKVEWMRCIHKKNRGKRDSAGGEITAFYDGFNHLNCKDWEYIVKLDGDLKFDEDYFEKCLAEFESDSKLGIGSGEVLDLINGFPKIVRAPNFHVRGAAKMYRHSCWNDISGIKQIPGWDTIDLLKANQCGWKTRTFKNITMLHLKPTGSEQGLWKDSVKNGICNYNAGYQKIFMLLKCVSRFWASRPYLVEGFGLFCGYLLGYLKKNRIEDKALLEYIKEQQIAFILKKESVWSNNYYSNN